jgi:hypothetical protein
MLYAILFAGEISSRFYVWQQLTVTADGLGRDCFMDLILKWDE